MSDASIRLSVIVSVYQVEQYLPQCLSSLVSQSYNDAEFILVDDGSTDDSGLICDQFAKRDARIHVIHTMNSGVSVARNIGTEAATGDYLVFLDGDDWLHIDAIRTIAEECSRYRPDILIGDYIAELNGRSSMNSFFTFNDEVREFVHSDRECLVRNCLLPDGFGNPKAIANVGVPWAKAYRREFVNNRGLHFVPGLRRMQDTIFNMYSLYIADTIVYVPMVIYHYRKNTVSATAKYDPYFDKTAERILDEINRFICTYGADWLKNDYYTKAVKLFCEWVRLSLVPSEAGMTIRDMSKAIKAAAQLPVYAKAIEVCEFSKLGRAEFVGALLWRFHAWKTFAWSYYCYRALSNRKYYGDSVGGFDESGKLSRDPSFR